MHQRKKTVTRRLGWWFLKPGDQVMAVEKARGLKRGETVRPIGRIRIVKAGAERLKEIDPSDLAREGFPAMARAEFIREFCRTHRGCKPTTKVNRIEFEFL